MLAAVKQAYAYLRESFENPINAWSLAAAGTTAFIVIIYSKQKEAILLSEIDCRKDLMTPCQEHGKPHNYAIWIERPLEFKTLCNYLKAPVSRVIALVGIPQSGRSKLAVKAIIESYPHEVVHMDVRNSPFDDVNGLEQRFHNKTFDINDAIASLIRGISKTMQGELDALEEVTKPQNVTDEEGSAESLNRFKRALRRFKQVVLPENKPCLLCINHMEAFSSLTRDKTGMRALEYFLFWLTNLTRDRRNIRVVISCTPLFFYDWLIDVPFRDTIHIVGIGNLEKNEAEAAYTELLNTIVLDKQSREQAPDFETVYNYFGGRIHDLTKFVEEYSAAGVSVEGYSDLGSIISKFAQALKPELFQNMTRNNVNYPVTWDPEHLVDSWKLLLSAKDANYAVPYHVFIEKVPMHIFYSLMRHSLVTYRPKSVTFSDTELCKTTDVVMFRRPLDRIAAEIILQRLDNETNL